MDVLLAYLIFRIAQYQAERDRGENWQKKVDLEHSEIYQDLLAAVPDEPSANETSQMDRPRVLTKTELDNLFQEKNIIKNIPSPARVDPWVISLLALWNPFVIASCIGQSTAVFSNICILGGLYHASRNELNWTAFCIAMTSYLSVYPIVFVVPFTLLISERRKASIIRIVVQILGLIAFYLAILLFISHQTVGSWNFMNAFYGTLFFVRDLQPNMGVYWYFVIEMFDHFRTFFVIVFQMIALCFALPTGLAFRYAFEGISWDRFVD